MSRECREGSRAQTSSVAPKGAGDEGRSQAFRGVVICPQLGYVSAGPNIKGQCWESLGYPPSLQQSSRAGLGNCTEGAMPLTLGGRGSLRGLSLLRLRAAGPPLRRVSAPRQACGENLQGTNKGAPRAENSQVALCLETFAVFPYIATTFNSDNK